MTPLPCCDPDRPARSLPGGAVGWLVLVFVLTGVAVYWLGQRDWRATQTFTAVASLSIPDRPGLSADVIQREILSDPALHDLVRSQAAAPDADADRVERLRRNVKITSELAMTSGQWRTTISYAGGDAQQAIHVVNELARHFASSRAATEPTRPAALAQTSSDSSRGEFQKAQAELDEFLAQHFAQLRQRADRLQQKVPPSSMPAATSEMPKPQADRTSENPQWVELNDRIARMEQQRADLLLSRTAMHPSVKDLEAELGRLERQLAAISRRTPPSANAAAVPAPDRTGATTTGARPALPGTELPPIAQADAAAAQRYGELRQAVEQAHERWKRAAEAERQTQWPNAAVGAIETQLAQRCEPPGATRSALQLVVLALLAGLAAATALGMVTVGMAEPPLASAAEVQAALPIPLLGVISSAGTGSAPVDGRRLAHPARSLWAFSGALLLAVCAGVVASLLL